MHGHGYRNRINIKMRAAALVLACALLMFVFVSVFFIAYEAGHECTGEDCPVCALILQCENNLRQIGGGSGPAAAAVCFSAVLTAVVQILISGNAYFLTPVSGKTRLNY